MSFPFKAVLRFNKFLNGLEHCDKVIRNTNSRFFSTYNRLFCFNDPGSKGTMTEDPDIEPVLRALAKDRSLLWRACKVFCSETKKFVQEKREELFLNSRQFDAQETEGVIDIVFKFQNQKDTDIFSVNTDAKLNGKSTASFKITQNETGLFSGIINTEVPKDGNVRYSGYANINSRRVLKSYLRPSYFKWRHYTHLVLKVRGDGRTYNILLATPGEYNMTYQLMFSHPLYTRGGPYWQIAKIPFNHFVPSRKGRLEGSSDMINLDQVAKFGVTVSGLPDGPFKLEIDYVGVEQDYRHKSENPYESYYIERYYG